MEGSVFGFFFLVLPICIVVPILIMFYLGWRSNAKNASKSDLRSDGCELCGVKLHDTSSSICSNCKSSYFENDAQQPELSKSILINISVANIITKAHRLTQIGIVITIITAFLPLKFSIIAIPFILYSVWRMTRAIQVNVTISAVYLMLALIPVVNILTLVSLNIRGSNLLKASGVKVGIFERAFWRRP